MWLVIGLWVAISAVAAPLVGYFLGGDNAPLRRKAETALAPRKHP
ncbi:hypothetical protein FHS84_000258 [Rhizomicrobium electricum]|jgi:hypothetical protein|nr:hypothetical protein [Rhizomicrobium electricum]